MPKKIKMNDQRIGKWQFTFKQSNTFEKVTYNNILNGHVTYPVFFNDIDTELDLIKSMSLKKVEKYCADVFMTPVKFFPFLCQLGAKCDAAKCSIVQVFYL